MHKAMGRMLLPFLPAIVLPGCFIVQPVSIQDLRDLDRMAVVRIATVQGDECRGIAGPGDLEPSSLHLLPSRYGPSSWVVCFGGWPLVYTSGKLLRYQVEGGDREIPLEEIKKIYIEKYSWPLTLISLPLTLPPGIIDFVVHNIRFGFENVDTRFDTYSRPPAGRPDVGRIQEEVPRMPPVLLPRPPPAQRMGEAVGDRDRREQG